MINFKHKGNFDKFIKFVKKALDITEKPTITSIMERCMENLRAATPVDSGLTAQSWSYTVTHERNKTIIQIINSNIQNGTSVAFLLEHGHATATGGWVPGKHFIDPEIKKTYDEILETTWKEVRRL